MTSEKVIKKEREKMKDLSKIETAWVDEQIRQSKEDLSMVFRMLAWGIVGATVVVTLICFTCSPESATHLVNCFRHLVGN